MNEVVLQDHVKSKCRDYHVKRKVWIVWSVLYHKHFLCTMYQSEADVRWKLHEEKNHSQTMCFLTRVDMILRLRS